ncbi:MAG: SPOR domain-containing protein [Armatimonadetes bacterium]|nr:SPOR domain-containing protein [Armatimonadota bacterium]
MDDASLDHSFEAAPAQGERFIVPPSGWLRYWPAALFMVSMAGVFLLTWKARALYENAESTGAEPRGAVALRDTPVNELPAPVEGGAVPTLFDFGAGSPPAQAAEVHKPGLFEQINNRLSNVASNARAALRQADLTRREDALIGGRLFDPDDYLASHPLPPLDLSVPPIVPLFPGELSARNRAALLGNADGTVSLTFDPAKFRDDAAMRAFILDLTRDLISAGYRPDIKIVSRPAGPGATKPDAPLRMAGIPLDRALPKPPADIAAPAAGPVFRPNLPTGDATPSAGIGALPDVVAVGAPPPGVAAAKDRPASADVRGLAGRKPTTPGGDVDLAGSDAHPAQPRTPLPPKPAAEPRVALRIHLASTPDRKAAEASLAKLQENGLGGSLNRTHDGLDYFVVQSKVFTRRSEAERELARVRGWGYEAWLN